MHAMHGSFGRLSVVAAAVAMAALALTAGTARWLPAQDFRVGGGVTLPRGANAGHAGSEIGGQVQASIELGPRTNGLGVRLDLLFAQSAAPPLSIGEAVVAGRTARTMAAAGGLFYRHEVRDFAPYLLAGGGAYGQSGMPGVALGAHGGIGVDYAGARWRPFAEARMHRWRGDGAAVTVQQRERSLISALVGLRF
ncbi:MAG: hypothetical protein IT359_13880 [Gemmatimonadaceae bacterium]|nr:hypothetical protein [Gemmatimonadaceae bacterium]